MMVVRRTEMGPDAMCRISGAPTVVSQARPSAVQVAQSTGRGQIPRDDVAEIITRLVVDGTGVRRQFEVISGDTPIAEALAAL